MESHSPPTPKSPSRAVRNCWSWFKNLMESIIFSATAKLLAVRLLILAALVNLCVLGIRYRTFKDDMEYTGYTATYLGFIAVHHTASAFKFSFIPQLFDLLLVFLELLSVFVFVFFPYEQWDALGVGTGISSFAIILLLLYLFSLRILSVIRHKGRNLNKAFDLLEDRPRKKGIAGKSRLPVGFSLLLGRSLTSRQFLGESVWVRLIRSILAWVFLVGIILVGLGSIVVQPLLEFDAIPTREIRTSPVNYPSADSVEALNKLLSDAPAPWKDLFQTGVWSFYFGTNLGTNYLEGDINDKIQRAINVSITFQDYSGTIRELPCKNVDTSLLPSSDKRAANSNTAKGSLNDFFMIGCPDISTRGGLWTRSEVLITVDFGLLDAETGLKNTMGPIAIYPSLTTDIGVDDLLYTTAPFPLPPGGNYIATVSVRGRTTYETIGTVLRSFLGILGDPDGDFIIPHFKHVVHVVSPSPSPNISSITLLTRFDTLDFRVDVDAKEKSFIAGFATVGGFWTAASAIFAVIFGTSLLHILFGSRELAIFGLIQTLEKKKIVNAYIDAYPQLRNEINSVPSQRGIVALLQDHLLDTKLLKDALEAEKQANEHAEEHADNSNDMVELVEQQPETPSGHNEDSLLLAGDLEANASAALHHV